LLTRDIRPVLLARGSSKPAVWLKIFSARLVESNAELKIELDLPLAASRTLRDSCLLIRDIRLVLLAHGSSKLVV